MVFPDEIELNHQLASCQLWSENFGLFEQIQSGEKPDTLKRFFYNIYEEQVFYCGSFNPFHMGHKACIELLPRDKNLTLVPDLNPWKRRDDSLTPFQVLNGVISFFNRGQTSFNIYPGFLALNSKEGNPTIDWVKRCIFPKISLLMGADSFLSLNRWKDAFELLESLHCVYICSREISTERLDDEIKNLKRDHPQLKIEYLGNHPFESESSSKIRNK